MRSILSFLFLIVYFNAQGQRSINIDGTYHDLVRSPMAYDVMRLLKQFVPPEDTSSVKRGFSIIGKKGFIGDGSRWWEIEGGGTGSPFDSTIDGSRVSTSSIPELAGRVPGFTTYREALEDLYYPSQFPTFLLTGGFTQEYMAAGGNLSYDVTGTVGRLSATLNIDSVKINGNYQSFANPSAPGTTAIVESVSIPRNINTTISGYARSSDGKITSSSTLFNWSARRYFGWVNDTTGFSSSSSDALIRSLGSELSNNKSKTWTTSSPTGEQFYVYAYAASGGQPESIMLNGFETMDALRVINRSFTTATGHVANYVIIYTRLKQNTWSRWQVQ